MTLFIYFNCDIRRGRGNVWVGMQIALSSQLFRRAENVIASILTQSLPESSQAGLYFLITKKIPL